MRAPQETLKEIPANSDLRQSTEIILENYKTYHLTKEQLKSLQEWIKEQNGVK